MTECTTRVSSRFAALDQNTFQPWLFQFMEWVETALLINSKILFNQAASTPPLPMTLIADSKVSSLVR